WISGRRRVNAGNSYGTPGGVYGAWPRLLIKSARCAAHPGSVSERQHWTSQMRRALITGGAGFIDSHLAEALLEQGDRVTVIDDLFNSRFEKIEHLTGSPNFHIAIETLTNQTVMHRLVRECDTIFPLAAAIGVDLIVRDPIHTIETNAM